MISINLSRPSWTERKLSVEHRKKKSRENGKRITDKTPTVLGLADTTNHTRDDRLTFQLCGDSDVACRWINGVACRWINGEFSANRKNRTSSKNLSHVIEKGNCRANLENR